MGMRISPIARMWLEKKRSELRAAGWTMAELYRRNRSRGIAWTDVWDMELLSAIIESDGCISFRFQTPTGHRIKQTAWPKKYHQKRSTKNDGQK
jgi:hypothetical protein